MLLLQIVVCVLTHFLITSAPAVDFQHEKKSSNSGSTYEDLPYDINTRKPEDKSVEIPFNSTTTTTVSIQTTSSMGSISRKTRDSNTVLYNDAAPSSPAVKNRRPHFISPSSDVKKTSSGADPTCNEIRCERFSDEDVNHLIINYDDTDVRVGSRASFSCRNNNQLIDGTSVAVCLRNGEWSARPSQCKEPQNVCPPVKETGAFDVLYSDGRNINSTATFYCRDINHLTEGTHIKTCLSTGEWSEANPTCRDVRCSKFSDEDTNLLNVHYDDSGYLAGSTATFSCKRNDQMLSGSATAVCLRTEKWSSPPPQCIESQIRCPLITENGAFNVVYNNDLNINSIATFYCIDVNNVIEGLPSRTCLSTGKWSGANPTCKGSCILPPVSGGRVGTYEVARYRGPNSHESFVAFKDGKVIKDGEKVILHCNRGFMLTGNSSIDGHLSVDEVTCENGSWSKSLQCKSSDCTNPAPSIVHGKPVNISQVHNAKITFKCDEGYELNKNSTIRCRYGNWTGKPPECVKIIAMSLSTCAPPENPPNGKLNYTSLEIGSDLTAECDVGYRLMQTKPVYCKADLTWNLSDLKCEVVICRPPNPIKNGKLSYISLKFGSELVYKCDEGYIAQPTETVRCQADGTWSRSDVTCEAVSCDIPEKPENGGVVYRSLKFGSALRFTCKDGYQLHQTKPVYCTSNGTWSIAEVSCNVDKLAIISANTCDPPDNPDNGQVSYSSLKFGSKLRFRCDDGYELQADGPVTCTEDGTWSRTNVKCVGNACDLPDNPANGQVIFTSLGFGSELKFKCNHGYSLPVGMPPVYCKRDGTWSRMNVRCEKPCILQSLLMNLPEGLVSETEVDEDADLILIPYGSSVKLRCEHNMNPVGDKFAKCGRDRTWEYDENQCKENFYKR